MAIQSAISLSSAGGRLGRARLLSGQPTGILHPKSRSMNRMLLGSRKSEPARPGTLGRPSPAGRRANGGAPARCPKVDATLGVANVPPTRPSMVSLRDTLILPPGAAPLGTPKGGLTDYRSRSPRFPYHVLSLCAKRRRPDRSGPLSVLKDIVCRRRNKRRSRLRAWAVAVRGSERTRRRTDSSRRASEAPGRATLRAGQHRLVVLFHVSAKPAALTLPLACTPQTGSPRRYRTVAMRCGAIPTASLAYRLPSSP